MPPHILVHISDQEGDVYCLLMFYVMDANLGWLTASGILLINVFILKILEFVVQMRVSDFKL